MNQEGKRPVPDIQPPAEEADGKAFAESQALANDQDLEKLQKLAEHTRREAFRDHYHKALVVLFWGFFGVLSASGLVWAIHLLTPECWHFLTPQQLSKIESTFFSGVLAGGLSVAMKSKYLGTEKDR